jgi:transketolase
MRRLFADLLLDKMAYDPNIYLVTADLGYKMWDQIAKVFRERFMNVGAAEQSMLDICVGFSYANKIPIAYSITSFLLYRGFETIRTYIDYENLPVKLVGSGRGKDYEHDGISHWADDDLSVLGALNNIQIFYPNSLNELEDQFDEFLYNGKPSYMNLTRKV